MSTTFEQALQALIRDHLGKGAAPADVVSALTRQANLLIDRNNLEFDLLKPVAKRR